MDKDNDKHATPSPRYPTAREFQSRIGNTLAKAVLIGAAAALAPNIASAKDDENGKETKKEAPAENIGAEIAKLASLLGDDNFEIRKKATERLIAIGKIKNKKGEAPYKEAVLQAMGKARKSKDPEVAQRAKRIIAALAPKPTPDTTPPPRRLLGKIRANSKK